MLGRATIARCKHLDLKNVHALNEQHVSVVKREGVDGSNWGSFDGDDEYEARMEAEK